MANIYQAKHFTGEQLDNLMQKVQSGEIAGRGLDIDAQGNLFSTVPGYSRKVFSYTHTGNREVRPTDLDVTTGVFTAPGHGITNHEHFYVTVDYPDNIGAPYSFLPSGLVLGGTTNTSTGQLYYAQVIDADHFCLSTTATDEIITYTAKNTMDLSKFHFEFVTPNELTIEGLNLNECLMVVKGKIQNNFKFVHPTNRVQYGSNGSQNGAVAYDLGIGVDAYGSCYFGRPGYNFIYATLEFKMMDEKQVYQVNNVDFVYYTEAGAPTLRHNRQYFHIRLTTDCIEGITMYGTMNGGFYNGTTVEVYAK